MAAAASAMVMSAEQREKLQNQQAQAALYPDNQLPVVCPKCSELFDVYVNCHLLMNFSWAFYTPNWCHHSGHHSAYFNVCLLILALLFLLFFLRYDDDSGDLRDFICPNCVHEWTG